MEKIKIVKLNNTHAKIESDSYDLILDFRDHFSFYADNYRMMPMFKSKRWDGKIRLVENDGKFLLGMWTDIKEYCDKHEIQCEVDSKLNDLKVPEEKVLNFISKLNVHSNGEMITPHDYQIDSVMFALRKKRCALLSPTSSGKSLIQYILTRLYENLVGDSILVVVPTISLVTQMRADFIDYSSEVEWDTNRIYCSTDRVVSEFKSGILISTYQSLIKMKPQFFDKFKAVLIDEVHKVQSKSVTTIIKNCKNASFRVGLTGTLHEGKTNESTLKGLTGEVKHVITTKELMDSDRVAQLNIHVLLFKYDELSRKVCRSSIHKDEENKRKHNYSEEIDFLTTCVTRNNKIVNLVKRLKGNTIVMIHQIKHGKLMKEMLEDSLDNRKVYLYSDSDKNERENIRQNVENETDSVIVGSLGTISTGVSIKRLHNLVFAHPTKSKVTVLQSVGRILRKSKHGNEVKMFDIIDDLSIGVYENYTLNHGKDRIRHYSEQEFNYDIREIYIDDSI